MFNARKLRPALVSLLSCAALTAISSPAAAQASSGSPRARTATHRSVRAKGAHTRCATKSSLHKGRRARLAGRNCAGAAHPQRLQNAVKNATKLRRSRSRRSGEAGPANPTPTTVAQPSSAAQDSATAIAAALATPCQNTELTPDAENIALVRGAILCLVNRKRAESNEAPLQTNPQLEQAAEEHCAELIADDYFAHVSPSGETPVDRIRATGYLPSPGDGYVIGENLAWGTYQLATPQAIVAAWIASPGHLANILEAQYTETGIGVTPAVPASLAEGAPGATYAQEFGVVIQ